MFQQQPLKGKKPKPSWFDQELQRNNGNTETLIAAMDDGKIFRDAQRIFKDLMYRNVNLELYGGYFLDPRFINALYNNAYDRWLRYSTLYQALFMFNEHHVKVAPQETDSINYEVILMTNYSKLVNAYIIICEILDMVRTTGQPSYLYSLSDKLLPFREELRSE